MTRYLLYFLTGFAHALVILFYRGYLDAAPTIYSTIALVSGMVLFGIASWLKLFLEKIGALMALLCILAITPWTVEAGQAALSHDAFLSGVLIITHAILLFFALATFIISLRYVVSKGSWLTGTTNPGLITKIVISVIPVAIIIGWLLIMGKIQ